MHHALRSWLQHTAQPVLSLPRPAKRALALAVDGFLCVFTVWLAFYLRLDEWLRLSGDDVYQPQWAVLASLAIAIPLFVTNGFYRLIFRYAGLSAVTTIIRAFAIYFLIYGGLVSVIGLPGVPRSIGAIQPMLLLAAVAGTRWFIRYWLGGEYQERLRAANRPKALIYGAGVAGRQLAMAMANSHEMRVVGFLDDDDRLHGHVLNGLQIYNPSDLATLVGDLQVSDVLLAIPSINRRRRNEILQQIRDVHVSVRTLPSVTELAQGKVSISDLRELDIDDLLSREAVMPNHILLAMNIRSKTVMVTGAGGSIGSELCRQILAVGPNKLLLIEQSEFALYKIQQELQEKLGQHQTLLIPLLASVQDADRMHEIMATWRPNTVYHAAAYKHVPLVEHNPAEGIKNNVLGTLACAQAAMEAGVAHFVLVSTDKAVRPTNIMGASKRLAEMVLQALSESAVRRLASIDAAPPIDGPFVGSTTTRTICSMVRFGNVLDSSGSVVPKFRQQIRDGGPVTVTHPEVTRFFMTIPEAAQLVIQAGAMAKGGDVFVLDMGQPVKIMDLARRMIALSGLDVRDETNPDGDIEISITGLRPGEKLYEELLIGHDPKPTSHPRIMKAHEEFVPWLELKEKLRALEAALSVNDVGVIQHMMEKLVPGYTPSEEIVDWVYLEQGLEIQA